MSKSSSSSSKPSSNSSEYSSDKSGKEKNDTDNTAECIRNVGNFSDIKSMHLIDNGDFSPKILNMYLELASPKLVALLDKIKKLDEKDMKTHGKLFKHMIFTDIKNSKYGAKLIASALSANGFNSIYHPQGKGFAIHPDEKLLETKNNNFATLMSKKFYDRNLNIKFRKNILLKYNERPENINGELIRFIILDQGFKEGIDLYDVKYVHLFEPLVVNADEKQAIGRATRFCGQKGLEFHPKYGWPLYVFRYEVIIENEMHQKLLLNSKQFFDLYLKYANIDLRKVVFASELENIAIESAVDAKLTSAIHKFSIEKPPPIFQDGGSSDPMPPPKIMGFDEMQEFISNRFMKFKYPKSELKNQCLENKGGNGNLINFTETQDFVRNFFQVNSAYKGLLLFHSVGTGKTCSAIATATSSFENEGYTILWVTRHTLKNDIWKNMYNQVCSLTIRDKLEKGELKLPKKITGPMKYLSKNWIEPISYKQFSNMLLKKNKIYDEMVRRNGAEDPLRKTFIIIDEAHKLYSSTVAGNEKPNMDVFEKMITNSYMISGKDSVRLLAMTATPYTEDGMEMIKLINLFKEHKDKLPVDFDEFSKKFLNDKGFFVDSKKDDIKNKLSGYISYLNRSQDARNFAYPVLENVFVPMTVYKRPEFTKAQEYSDKIKEYRERLQELKKMKRDLIKSSGKEAIAKCIEIAVAKINAQIEILENDKKVEIEKCKLKPLNERKECKDNINNIFNPKIKEVKKELTQEKSDCRKNKGGIKLSSSKESGIDMLTKELKNHKENSKIIKNIKISIKEYISELKKAKENLQSLKNIMYNDKLKMNKIKDKNELNQAKKEFKLKYDGKLKELFNIVKDINSKKKNETNKLQLFLIEIGKKDIGNVSQFTKLADKCDVIKYTYKQDKKPEFKPNEPQFSSSSSSGEEKSVDPTKFYCVEPYNRMETTQLKLRIKSCKKGETPHPRFKKKVFNNLQSCVEKCSYV